MNPQDETTFRESQDIPQSTTIASPAAEAANKKNAPRWQTVSIGGVAGVAMGLAASQAYEAFAAEDVELAEEDEAAGATTAEAAGASVAEVHQATVNQNLSFGDAFAAARAEVGPGGVFLWHGQLYNTFTAEEWQGMSDVQKDEFAADVQPYLSQQTEEPASQTSTHTSSHTESTTRIETVQPDDNVHHTAHVEDTAEPEVHFLGVETRELGGQTVNVGHMTVDDVQVALVDVDNDQIFDISLTDNNRNGEIEDNEISDISDSRFDVDTFQRISDAEQMQQEPQLEQASYMQDDLAPDMPDYMNDADVDIV